VKLPWASAAAQARVAEILAADGDDLERADAALRAHAERMDRGLMLYAGTNAGSLMPSLGDPGEKLQPGLEHLDVLEVLTTNAVAASMRAPHADVRVQSATLANLAVYAGLTPVGATIAALPQAGGGHFSHHEVGAAGIRGHRVVELPYADFDVDLDALPGFLDRERPQLIVLGGALMLFPHRLAEIAAHGVPILYDASHTAGLIAGGRFQDPLGEGAAVMTFSTYKSYGGPPGGAIVTRDPAVAERVFRAVYPGLTANYDAGRLLGLLDAATRLRAHGAAYADRCIASAQALGQALRDAGVPVAAAERGFTRSHHLAVHADVKALERAGIYASTSGSYVRLGTQELVTRGLGPEDMPGVAARIVAALGPPA
jgi:glycine hydroxymethyltransferase